MPKRNQDLIRTTYPTSWGYTPLEEDGDVPKPVRRFGTAGKSRFEILFQYTGTSDNSAYYCVPAALNFRQNLCGGEEAIYNYIRMVAQRGADLLAMLLGTEVMDDLDAGYGLKTMGSYEASDRRDGGSHGWAGGLRDCAMANILLPVTIVGATVRGSISMGPGGSGSAGGLSPALRQSSYGFPSSTGLRASSGAGSLLEPIPRSTSPLNTPSPGGPIIIHENDVPIHIEWMHKTLTDEYHTSVTIYEYDGRLWTRISGQIYLELKDFEWLAGVLKALFERVRAGESLRGRDSSPGLQGVDLESVRLTPTPSRQGTGITEKRFDVTQGGWVGS